MAAINFDFIREESVHLSIPVSAGTGVKALNVVVLLRKVVKVE
uniref:Uncharacterized protein n=1 Tax=Rhizophora mucronata TaxID=61149 RepID=A0A2P2MQK3_RHIMU